MPDQSVEILVNTLKSEYHTNLLVQSNKVIELQQDNREMVVILAKLMTLVGKYEQFAHLPAHIAERVQLNSELDVYKDKYVLLEEIDLVELTPVKE